MVDRLINGLFEIPGYDNISLHRNRNEGGIRIYYDNRLTVDICEQFSGIFDTHESLFLKISLKNKINLIIGSFYRPPSKSIYDFIDYLNEVLLIHEIILSEKCLLVGDFNLDLLQKSSKNTHGSFFDLMSEFGFRMLIDQPTHCNAQSGELNSIIDHIWINFVEDLDADVLECPISDHLPIYLSIKLNYRSSELKKVQFRYFSNENWNKLENEKTALFSAYDVGDSNINLEMSKFDSWLQNFINGWVFSYKDENHLG